MNDCSGCGLRSCDGICYDQVPADFTPEHPAEPGHTDVVWYRGWECGYDGDAAFWTSEPWRAAKGGWDLDCRQTSGRTWSDLLDEIDAEEA